MWYVEFHLGAEQTQTLKEDGAAGHAVHVIVAIDTEFAAGLGGGEDTLGRLGNAGK